MLKLNDKYRIHYTPIDFKILELLDFQDIPLINLECDNIFNKYISYLIEYEENIEQRALVQISEKRLKKLLSGEISVKEIFARSENNLIYILNKDKFTGDITDTYLVNKEIIIELLDIEEDYYIINIEKNEKTQNNEKLISYARQAEKLIFDLYIKSDNLINNIKPWVFYKIIIPTTEIIKNYLDIEGKDVNKKLAFSNIRDGSLGISIEIEYDLKLFKDIPEALKISQIIDLFNADDKESFNKILYKTKESKVLNEYIKIIKAILSNKADVKSSYINPIQNEIYSASLDYNKAKKIKKIIDEEYPEKIDIEEIHGIFLEIDLDKKEPIYTIRAINEDYSQTGKIDIELISKITNDKINIGKDEYIFTIRTIFKQETTLKKEQIFRKLINYKPAIDES